MWALPNAPWQLKSPDFHEICGIAPDTVGSAAVAAAQLAPWTYVAYPWLASNPYVCVD
nr:hypothetical protein CPGR_00347 [Mycolicibacterium malmesburyense]